MIGKKKNSKVCILIWYHDFVRTIDESENYIKVIHKNQMLEHEIDSNNGENRLMGDSVSCPVEFASQ